MKKLLIVLPILFLVACDKNVIINNKDYYIKNEKERNEMLIKCKNVDVKTDLNCYNAYEADKFLKEKNAKKIDMKFDVSGIN